MSSSPGDNNSLANGNGTLSNTVDLDRVLALFNGPNSNELYERHYAAVEKLNKTSAQTGFAIRDLGKVQQILELTLKLIQSGSTEFLQPAEELIRVLAKPFVKKTSTDEFRLLSNIASILTAVGQVFCHYPATLQIAASEFLLVFSSGYGNRPSTLTPGQHLQELDVAPGVRQYHTNQSLIARSGVVRDVVAGLATAILTGDEVLVMSLTLTLTQFSYHTDNITGLIEAGILSCLPHLLSYDYRHPLTPSVVELVWNMLDLLPQATRSALTSPQPPLASLYRGKEPLPVRQHSPQPRASSPQPRLSSPQLRTSSPPSRLSSPLLRASSPPSAPAPEPEPGPEPAPSTPQAEPRTLDESLQGIEENENPESEPRNPDESERRPTSAPTRRPSLHPDVVLPAVAAALTMLLRTCLYTGFRVVDKELRNDILVIINLLLGSDHEPAGDDKAGSQCALWFSLTATEEGLAEALLAVSTSPELGVPEHDGIVKPWALTTEDLDYEMRQLAWRAVTAMCVHCGAGSHVVALASRWGLMRVLLAFVELVPENAPPMLTDAAASAQRRWPADQVMALRASALSRLFSLAPMLPDGYLAEDGPGVLLRFLSTGVTPAHVEGALRHLHSLMASAPEMAEALGGGGAIRVLLGLLQDGARHEGVRHYCLLLLALMCRLNTENSRRLRHEGGVAVLLGQLARCRSMDPTLPSPYTIAMLDALWTCVVPDRKNAARFLVEDGLDGLLELLEIGNRGHRAVLLSMLSDLLENPRSHPFFHEWRSNRDKQTAAHLLLTLWGEEEAARGMTSEGLLANMVHPLAGTGKRTQWVPQETITYGGLLAGTNRSRPNSGSANSQETRGGAVAAMLNSSNGESMLSKLYGCFRLLGFANFDYLDAADKARLVLVEKYVKFKQGEVWHDIKGEFESTGMRPTAADRERLASGIEMAEHLARSVRDTQAAILNRDLASQAASEAAFFEAMRAQRALEKEARFYKEDKSQLTLAELRDAKAKKEAMLRSSIRDFQFMTVDGE